MAASDERIAALDGERRELLELWLAAAEPAEATGYAAPRTEPERALAEIWADVLETGPVGIDDDFFALGGDSIVAIVVVAKAQAAGLELSSHDLFETPTIRRLAALATPVGPGATAETVPTAAGAAALPLTPLQAGMLFHATGTEPAADYLVQVSCRLRGDIDVAELSRAWQMLAERHPALRSWVHADAAGPRMLVEPAVTVPVEPADWSDARTPAEQAERLAHYLAADRRRGLRPDWPPLLRVLLARLPDGSHRFVLTHHHLILDGWSQQLLLRELVEHYDGLGGGPAAGPPVGTSLADYHAWLARQDLAVADRYWRERLAGFAPSLVNRTGRACAPGRYARLDHTTGGATLAGAAGRHRSTASVLVEAGWALLLAGLTDTDDVAFGVTVSGRPAELAGIQDAVGMFINTLPMRVRVRPDQRTTDWLGLVRRHGAALLRYQFAPLPLVERSRRGGAPGALFDTLLVVENFPSYVDEGHASRRLAVSDVTVHVEEGYPLVMEVRPGPPERLLLRYHQDVVPVEVAHGLLAGLAEYVESLAGELPDRVGELAVQVQAAVARAAATARQSRLAAERGRLRAATRQAAGGGGDG